jgi:hypothetical protein
MRILFIEEAERSAPDPGLGVSLAVGEQFV